ncbi:MAG: hypothetical protein M5U26_01635 [Planctomycetota bacterium]|nr:hypothetical protein [Planctomycetota bacterium]
MFAAFNAYRHTQAGTVIRCTVFAPAIAMLAAAPFVAQPAATILTATGLLLGAVGLLFHQLRVEVQPDAVELALGPGLLRKRIEFREVRAARAVRNHWLMGWGIRWIGKGWMWNVSGLDAVELEYANGRVFRIGTDDAANLLAAIQAARGV